MGSGLILIGALLDNLDSEVNNSDNTFNYLK